MYIIKNSPKLKCAIPRTPIKVARRCFGANIEQYVAAATHIKWHDKASMASNGKHHQAFLESNKNRVE